MSDSNQENTKKWYEKYRWQIVIALVVITILLLPKALQITIGSILLALTLLLILLPLIPGFVNLLANEPNKDRPSPKITEGMDLVAQERAKAHVGPYKPYTFAFFTFLAPGQVKAIVRGERFWRFIMRYDGRSFKGDQERTGGIQKRNREYWEILETAEGSEDSHPIPDSDRNSRFDLVWLWSRYVYNLTGAVFTGIPPFQTVQVYQLERLRKFMGIKDDIVLIRVEDYSDHVRAAEYQFFVQIPGAETNDQVKVDLKYALTVKVVNPYKVYYDADGKWFSRLTTAVFQEVSAKVRQLGYMDVIARKGVKNRQLIECVMALNENGGRRDAKNSIADIGLEIKEAELIEVGVNDPELAKALADVAKATADAEARIRRGEAEATAVEQISAAANRHGENGRRALEIEGRIRTVSAAKDGVILNFRAEDDKDYIDSRVALLRKSIEEGGK